MPDAEAGAKEVTAPAMPFAFAWVYMSVMFMALNIMTRRLSSWGSSS